MATKLLIVLCCVFAASVVGGGAEDLESYSYERVHYNRTAFGDSVDRASARFLREAVLAVRDENVISSPLSVQLLLSLYAAGTSGPLRDEIVSALGSHNFSRLHDSYRDLSSRFSGIDPSYFTVADKIYVAEGNDIHPDFLDVARSYHSEVESINFSDRNSAADIINKWASDKTRGNIPKAISSEDLSGAIAAALCNVIYFRGHWHVPFKSERTESLDFHVNRNLSVKKPTMRLLRPLYYQESERLGARLLELPYKEKNFRMIVILPNEIEGLSSVIERVAEYGLLDDVFALNHAGDIDLQLPKFEIHSGLDLNNLLPKVGISKIFTDPAEGIVRGQSIAVSKAFQKAFIKVDEEGATAGAFTGFVMRTLSLLPPPPPIQFHVDRPFLLAIFYEDIPLFLGTYVK